MSKTLQDNLISPRMATEDRTHEVPTIVELSEEDSDLVSGGPEVVNDPPNH